jgi:flavin-dependent dehydrogenase
MGAWRERLRSPVPERIVKIEARYDVVVAGGGLAGLCLAIQLERTRPGIRVLVVEKSEYPQPEAAHKVGESSVEVASHYFTHVLGLADLLAEELPKFGLRFFMSEGQNTDITTRLECGPSHYLSVPSFQIDRGHFENALVRRALEVGVDCVDGYQLEGIDLDPGDGDHRVQLKRAGERVSVACRWLVDASGRAALLKKKLELGRTNRHRVNAAWFRIDAPIDVDDWSNDPEWRDRLQVTRRLSTNHLMGEGYWVWLIPLTKDRTSVGIVADDELHPFSTLSSLDQALAWLERHEPQCAGSVRSHLDQRMDFRALKNYSHDVKKMFSADRWCLTGDAGVFVDPLYSPGSDFIGMANGFATDLISRDLRSESIDELAEIYDHAYRSLGRTFLITYNRQYPLMGNPRVMTTKVVWDFVMYWGGVALLFCRGKLVDPDFMDRSRPLLQAFAAANVRMQAFFREWDSASEEEPPLPPGAFIDYAEIAFLARLNRELLLEANDDLVLERLERNLELAQEIRLEIIAAATRNNIKLPEGVTPPTTQHLSSLFDRIYPTKES